MLADGLKPVERRAIYTAFESGFNYNKKHTKVGYIGAKTMGEYHPHGETSINDTIVRMGQPWTYSYPLIDRQGNFGSVSGETAGAARYIEGRLTFFAYKCFFEEFDLKVLETTRNYLDTKDEPLLLPARYPNILFNNSFGIGYGLSTGIPNFNFNEVVELTIKRLKGEEFDYKKDFLYPDSPTGCDVIDQGQFRDACRTGDSKFLCRATINIDEENSILNIVNLPPMVAMQPIIDKLVALSEKNVIQGIRDIRDDCKDDKLDYKISFRPEVDLHEMKEKLYKMTDLEKMFPIKFNLIHDFSTKMLNIYDIIDIWIEYRKVFIFKFIE